MANFKYTAKDSDGKALNGFFEASDYASALDVLRKKGLIIVSVSEASPKAGFSSASFGKKKIKMDDIVVFSRQLATRWLEPVTVLAAPRNLIFTGILFFL